MIFPPVPHLTLSLSPPPFPLPSPSPSPPLSLNCSCKRANDWISEAKYPVITRDTSDPTSTPVVLGKIKRIKSMQPKPLEEEISKSLGE